MPRIKNVFLLIENSEVVGAWSTLKMLCEERKTVHDKFPSYWSLVRKTKGGLIEFTEGGIGFEIHILEVHGYSRKTNDTEG
jgi:hypothetical protein